MKQQVISELEKRVAATADAPNTREASAARKALKVLSEHDPKLDALFRELGNIR